MLIGQIALTIEEISSIFVCGYWSLDIMKTLTHDSLLETGQITYSIQVNSYPILKELHWLPVSQRIVFKLMLIVHRSVNNIAPIYISELLKVYTPSRNLRSSNMSLLKEPTSKRTWGDRSFSVAAPRLWNHLPTKLKSCHSITRFKSLLKTRIICKSNRDWHFICVIKVTNNMVNLTSGPLYHCKPSDSFFR